MSDDTKISGEELFFMIPLYRSIKLSELSETCMEKLRYSNWERTIEGYNFYKGIETTFKIETFISSEKLKEGGEFSITMSCKRHGDWYKFYFYLYPKEQIIEKIGQIPSLADLHVAQIKSYRSVLKQDAGHEYMKAFGLAANGVGIGSFVYLRRVFEGLVIEAQEKAIAEGIEESIREDYMQDRIKKLKGYLPEFMVEHSGMYSILSMGVHQLDEQTCLENFSILAEGIELILEERLIEKQRQDRVNNAKKKVSGLLTQMNTKKDVK